MTDVDPVGYFRRAAAESIAADDPTGWFERVYAAAESGEAIVPWDHHEASPLLKQWAQGLDGAGKRALVIGCGLGEDAEFVSLLGYATTAFDISETAVRAAQKRFPQSKVDYLVADLFDPPEGWRGGFDLVVEIATVQALPESVRPKAIECVRELVRPGGRLYVQARVREEDDPPKQSPPWPLTRAEVEAFGRPEFIERLGPHWRAVFTAPPNADGR
ncbi:MAG TPA: SAM-dependent methyltransferase [Micromonosporaceae bacterium]|nr:SAM-dependent methyltransferase [Micromonosporaceae bacterium]